MYYYYTAAKRNKTDDEVLGHFYDVSEPLQLYNTLSSPGNPVRITL